MVSRCRRHERLTSRLSRLWSSSQVYRYVVTLVATPPCEPVVLRFCSADCIVPFRSASRLQTAFTILDEVIRATNRRVNAIEHIVIPRLESTVNFIVSSVCHPSLPQQAPLDSNNCSFADTLSASCCLPLCSELDEMDREDFFRLKKVQGKKKRVQAERDLIDKENQRLLELKDQEEADAAAGGGPPVEHKKKATEEGKDLLKSGEDGEEDVIF